MRLRFPLKRFERPFKGQRGWSFVENPGYAPGTEACKATVFLNKLIPHIFNYNWLGCSESNTNSRIQSQSYCHYTTPHLVNHYLTLTSSDSHSYTESFVTFLAFSNVDERRQFPHMPRCEAQPSFTTVAGSSWKRTPICLSSSSETRPRRLTESTKSV